MSDPTYFVLRLCLGVVLGVFAVTAAVRLLRRRSQTQAAPPEAEESIEDVPPVLPTEPLVPPPLSAPPEIPAAPGIPVWPYRPLDLLWMGLLFFIFASMSLAVAGQAPTETPRLPGVEDLVVSMGLQLLLVGITLAVVVRRIAPKEWLGLYWKPWPWLFLIAPATVLFMWGVFALLLASGYMEWVQSVGADTVQDTVRLLQTTRDPAMIGLMALAAVIVAPVCEEILFRGYLYPAAKRFTGPWFAGGCTALMFAAAHGNLMALLPLFVFGVVLVVLYEKTGSIWAPIAVHFCFNGATVVVQVLAPYLQKYAEMPTAQ